MKILDIRVMRGPNIWSNYRQQLIIMKLDLQELETRPTHRIPGFSERLKEAMPSLNAHRCSEGHKGGFFQRVEQGTWMGHVIEHLALELQTLAGMACGYGRTRSTGETGVYNVVFAYRLEEAGLYAAQAAIRVAETLIAGEIPDIGHEVENLRLIQEKHGLAPSLRFLMEEAQKLNIPVTYSGQSHCILGHGQYRKQISKNLDGNCSGPGLSVSRDIQETRSLLQSSYIPVPGFIKINSAADLQAAYATLRFPLALRKQDRKGSMVLAAALADPSSVETAFSKLNADQHDLILEEDSEGETYLLIMANHKISAVLRQTHDLHAAEGEETEAGMETSGIRKLQNTQKPLSYQEDFGSDVHPSNTLIAERTSRLLNLNLCQIKIVCHDIALPLNAENGVITEIRPGLDPELFIHATGDSSVNPVKLFISSLFPEAKTRIPLIASAAGSSSETCAVLISQMLDHAARKNSLAVNQGVFINGHQITALNGCNHAQASALLFDPCTEIAILECDPREILSAGLPFDLCDLAIISDPDDEDDVNEYRLRALQALLHTVADKGFVLLDSDQDRIYELRNETCSSYALYSTGRHPERIIKHCREGGLAAVAENGIILLKDGKWTCRMSENGDAEFLELPENKPFISALLPAVLAAHLSGLNHACIREAIQHALCKTRAQAAGQKMTGTAFYRKAS